MKRTNNGLELDFGIEGIEERKAYVEKLVREWEEKGKNLRAEDFELLADYMLYGKEEDGESVVDKGIVEIKTKHGTFERKPPESLEVLIEDPNFNEDALRPLSRTKYRVPKTTFKREENLGIKPLEVLWDSIDRLSAKIDFFSGKKALSDFPEPLQLYLSSLTPPTQYALYQMKHQLVEMRREQFTIRDSFAPIIQPLIPRFRYVDTDSAPESLRWEDSNYTVLPLGVYTENNPIFTRFIDKESFLGCTEEDRAFFAHKHIEDRLLENYLEENRISRTDKLAIDFRNPSHIYNLYRFYLELETMATNDPESVVSQILHTLNFYRDAADLSPEHAEILRLKIQKQPNSFIAKSLRENFGKTHTDNYISTIFKKNVCGAISDAAKLHLSTYLAREDRSKFKKCKKCGEVKLRDTRNFVRKARSSDGFSNCCKVCDKRERKNG